MSKNFSAEEKKIWATSRTKIMLQGLEGLAAKFNEEAHQNREAAEAIRAAANAIRTAQQKNEQLEQELAALKKAAEAPSAGKHAKDGQQQTGQAQARPAYGSLVRAITTFGENALVESLIDQGADLNERGKADGSTPLMIAAQFGNARAVSLLIEHGADLLAKDNEGKTALDYAMPYAYPAKKTIYFDLEAPLYKAVVIMLKQAAAKQQPKASEAPAKPAHGSLTAAIAKSDHALVKSLIAQGADLNEQGPLGGLTPLMHAVAVGNSGIVNLLIEAGADIQIKDRKGEIALDYAKMMLSSVNEYNPLHSYRALIVERLEAATRQQLINDAARAKPQQSTGKHHKPGA
jgi:hypothetical protein